MLADFFPFCINYILEVVCLHSNLSHPCPHYNHACLSPCGLFSWCTAATSNSYKSHYIIARRASPCAPPSQCAQAIGRQSSLAGLSARVIGPTVNPASFLGVQWLGKVALLELSIILFLVRLAFSAAPCNALSAERRDALHTNRHTGAGQGSIGDSRMVRTPNRSSYLIANIFMSFSDHFYPLMHFLKYLLFVWDPDNYLLLSALVFSGFVSSTRELKRRGGGKKNPLILRKSQETKTNVFVLSHVEALDYCSRHLFPGSFLKTGIRQRHRTGGISRLCVHQNKQKKKKSISAPSWAVPCCGTRLQLWSWCCSPKVSSQQLLWQCARRRSTRVSLPLIVRKRWWRWILMMTCRVLPARESRARAEPPRSSFLMLYTHQRRAASYDSGWCKCVWGVRVCPSQPRD